MKSRFFPEIKPDAPWKSLDGDLVEPVEPEQAEKLRRGIQKPASSRRLAWMLGREKKSLGDRTDETAGAAYVTKPPTRQYDKEKSVARTFLGGEHNATQLSDSNRQDPLRLPRSIVLTGTSGLKEATRGGSVHTHAQAADEDATVRFRQDTEEYEPETRSAHDQAASQTIELRKAALQAGIENFRIAHSGIDTLVPLQKKDDQKSRELIWDILTTRNDAPYSLAAKQLDSYVDMHVRNELKAQSARGESAFTGAAKTEQSDILDLNPLPAQRGARFTRDIYKTLVTIELEERENPLAMERVGGWALGVLAASGEHVASLKQDGLRALGKLTMGLLDTSAETEGRLAQRNDMDIPHIVTDATVGLAPHLVHDVKDAMKNDEFRVALQALHDAALFDEPADMIVKNLADIMRREDLVCSNEVAADILLGTKDAQQVFQKTGRDRVYTMRTPYATADTPASILNQSRKLTQTRGVSENTSVADRHNQTLHASSRLLGMRDEAEHSYKPNIVGDAAANATLREDSKLTRSKY